jgi:hypothetical protein
LLIYDWSDHVAYSSGRLPEVFLKEGVLAGQQLRLGTVFTPSQFRNYLANTLISLPHFSLPPESSVQQFHSSPSPFAGLPGREAAVALATHWRTCHMVGCFLEIPVETSCGQMVYQKLPFFGLIFVCRPVKCSLQDYFYIGYHGTLVVF